MFSERVDDVVALERRDRDHDAGRAARASSSSRGDLVEPLLRPVDEIHLVDGDDDVRDAEDRGDVRVAAGLLDDALARVDEDDPRASAVEAPVTMLRVYCTWPGASASWKRRRGVTNER